jgi:hypothetical protein
VPDPHPRDGATDPVAPSAASGREQDATTLPPVVDFPRTLRRLGTSLSVIGGVVVVTWLVLGAVGDGWRLARLAELFGLGLMVAFLVEVVVVGGSAVRGMLAAGERGDRLASGDVTLLPPQAGRRRS